MTQTMKTAFHYKRAIVTFLLAYVAITILATGLSLLVGAILHTPPAATSLQDQAYLLTEPFDPLLNLLVWMACAWLYFHKRTSEPGLYKEALALGACWLAIAVPVDFLGFVVIQNPLSLSPHDFYIGQFPWIYLIYLAVFLSPLCYVATVRIFLQRGSERNRGECLLHRFECREMATRTNSSDIRL